MPALQYVLFLPVNLAGPIGTAIQNPAIPCSGSGCFSELPIKNFLAMM